MRSQTLDIGILHFIGIGGIGMSGIAEVMHNLGYNIQGSDAVANNNVQRLRGLGIKIIIGHHERNIGKAGVVVVSSAVPKDNVEAIAARANSIPLVSRSEMLAELMRLKTCIAVGGTHGKTTTTSMIAAVLDAFKMDPTVINGGIINAYGTNARLGHSDWMVVEADESDGSFLRLPSAMAVVTNIDPEHLDYYGTFEALKRGFRQFVANIPFYGVAFLCSDNDEVSTLIGEISDRKLLTYGIEDGARVKAENLAITPVGTYFDVHLKDEVFETKKVLREVYLSMPGVHNVRNALAAIALGCELDIPEELIRKALANFSGVKRRFTFVGEVSGIKIFDDYGHHPVEIAAVLQTARQISVGRVIAVVQPHRYSRLKALFDSFCLCFDDADVVIVADVHPAGEKPIDGINRDSLVAGIADRGHENVYPLISPRVLPEVIIEHCEKGDAVIFLGAGTITGWANGLPQQLQELGLLSLPGKIG